ncbi:NAD(P)-dependent oxidoreductase [Paucibacter sp. XJ19-41]|uniref:NAD(P)-dependent oxidoreductase n=1 Tax=Paucibacter sp. XJ19-41 TaxID=2927824 RepID=UPI00234B1C7F|nr:NAD(P)-binding oxidoreductase [Paucibacter sp. XJ19-41]MDC6167396.1 SDR family oxidoreductase [Paucibacter sp. XJ19-41]
MTMTCLVVGASGATGRLLVAELLARGHRVRVLLRAPGRLPQALREAPGLSLVGSSALDLSAADLARQVEGCDAVASCIGHTMSWRGMFGPPRRLVTETTRRLCEAIAALRPARPVRFVLMCSAGVRNQDLSEPISWGQHSLLALLRLLLPPHADNEQAAEQLRRRVGAQAQGIEWAVLRPDALVDSEQPTPYTLHPSPTRSALFDSGRSSRINVAHCMAELLCEEPTWQRWKGRMPVLYDEA